MVVVVLGKSLDKDSDVEKPLIHNSNSIVLNYGSNAGGLDENENLVKAKRSEFKLIRILKKTTIEPMLFLHCLANNLIHTLNSNLYIDRVCRIRLNYTEEICRAYSHGGSDPLAQKDPAVEAEIQVHVSTLLIYENIIEFGPVIIIALFLGAWCDRYGTKRPMLGSVFGSLLYSCIFLIITLIPSLGPEFILLAFVPMGLCGGSLALNVTAYSYMAIITKQHNRSFRIILLHIIWVFGQPIGTYIGPKVFAALDFVPVYIVACGIYASAVLYGIIFVKEQIPDKSSCESESNPFSLSGVKAMLVVTFKRRKTKYLRRWVILLWVVAMLRQTMITCSNNLTYLFTRAQLKWNVQSYTQYQAIQLFASSVGHYVMAHLIFKVFKMSDQLYGLLSGIGYIATSLIFAFATAGWMMYFSAGLNMLNTLQLSATRSLLSKFVGSAETAKAFSFLSLTEAAIQIPMGTLFNIFYNYTVGFFPGAFYFIQTILNAIVALIFLYFVTTMKKHNKEIETKQNLDNCF